MVNVLSIHCLLIIVNLHFHIYEGVHAYSFLFLQLHFSSLIKFYTFLFHSPIFCLSYFCYACKFYLFFQLFACALPYICFVPSFSQHVKTMSKFNCIQQLVHNLSFTQSHVQFFLFTCYKLPACCQLCYLQYLCTPNSKCHQ